MCNAGNIITASCRLGKCGRILWGVFEESGVVEFCVEWYSEGDDIYPAAAQHTIHFLQGGGGTLAYRTVKPMAMGKLTYVLRKGMTSAPLPGAVTTNTSCRTASSETIHHDACVPIADKGD